MSYSDRVKCTSCDGSGTTGEHGCTDCLGKGLDHMAFVGGIEAALNDAYAEGRKDEREALTKAAQDVLAERLRQIEREGCSLEHDDEHERGELADAACCYAQRAASYVRYLGGGGEPPTRQTPAEWPWESFAWKPGTPRRDLVRAAALLLAEIERIDRLYLECKEKATRDELPFCFTCHGSGIHPNGHECICDSGLRPESSSS